MGWSTDPAIAAFQDAARARASRGATRPGRSFRAIRVMSINPAGRRCRAIEHLVGTPHP